MPVNLYEAFGLTPGQVSSPPSLQDFATQEAQRQGVDPKLVLSVIQTESGGDPKALSLKGARGPMQLMPGTARELGVNPNDPYDNIKGGISYLKKQLESFGTPALALAAYNAGPGAVSEHGGIPPYSETQNYIKKVSDKYQSLQSQDMPIQPQKRDQQAQQQGPVNLYQVYGLTPGKEQQSQVDQPEISPPSPSSLSQALNGLKQGAIDTGSGLVRGAGSIGSTLLAPGDILQSWIEGKGLNLDYNRQRRADIDRGLQELTGSNPKSAPFQLSKLVGEIAGTAGTGSAISQGLKNLPGIANSIPGLLSSIESGGMSLGESVPEGILGKLATRTAGGAVTGGASSGLVDPSTAGMGATVGGVLPGILSGAGATIKAVTPSGVSPEVAGLAQRAKDLGIDIPADRLGGNRFLNGLASSLDYIPFSGRTASMQNVNDQFKKAVSRTFGEESPNITQALRNARGRLGGEFESVLSGHSVKIDQQFLDDLAESASRAESELGPSQAKVIQNQINTILDKGINGEIDGKAAYNIKKTLDTIGNRGSSEAFYATDLKKSLMGALDRSLPPEEATAFATTRKEYGNMLDIEKLARNGAEGDLSVARLGNLKRTNNPDLVELADIAAQFMKEREGQHGALQRVMMAGQKIVGGGLAITHPYMMAALTAGGRGTNILLNSQPVKNAVTNGLLVSDLGQAAQPFLPAAYQLPGLLSGEQ
jgi:hypothetical protein